MNDQIRFDQDWHVTSNFSDGTATVEGNVHVAEERGLSSLCIVDRVCRSTDWVSDLVDQCGAANRDSRVAVSSGVEVEVVDTIGTLDAPSSATHADYLFVAADRLPTPTGPVCPEEARMRIEAGELFAAQAVEWLVRAYASATRRDAAVVLAHPLSILPRLGIDPGRVHPSYVRWLAGAMLQNEAGSELNESWRSPSLLVVDCFATAGVKVLPASGAESPRALGRFEWGPELLGGLSSLARVA